MIYAQIVKYLEDNKIAWTDRDFLLEKPSNEPIRVSYWNEEKLGKQPREEQLDNEQVAQLWFETWWKEQKCCIPKQDKFLQALVSGLLTVINTRVVRPITEKELQDVITEVYKKL